MLTKKLCMLTTKLPKTLVVTIVVLLSILPVSAQTVVGLGTNALGWGCITPNLGLEVGFAGHFSLSVDAGYNPFTLKENRPTQFWAVQPEFKYWFKGPIDGHAIGLHGLYGDYNFGLKRYRYDGVMYGGGISYTYSWRFRPRWALEGTVGFGYTRLAHDNVYERDDKYTCYGPSAKNCWNVSKAGIRITWIICDKPKKVKAVPEIGPQPYQDPQTPGSGFGNAMRKIDKLNNRR